MDDFGHIPVLLKEAVGLLDVKKGKWYVDATAGGGGHTQEILDLGGRVIAIDQDLESIKFLQKKFEGNKNVILQKTNFSQIQKVAQKNKIKPAGILFDLGLSSFQIEKSKRGFSFRKSEPLDMRMSDEENLTAYEIVNTYTKEELYELFTKLGEEHYASSIADNIVKSRGIDEIKTSDELAKIVAESLPTKQSPFGQVGRHPATKIFQALRMEVNMEIENLKTGISEGFEALDKQGRMVVISFHSLEDRIVKLAFVDFVDQGRAKFITKKPLRSSEDEVNRNVRSRSAKLRAVVKN